MELNDRKLKILQLVINDFISSAEPIGSRTLSKKYDMGISPATIRNEMSDLEDLGYLTHPHTSAGRIPSDKAYRLYVDQLMDKYELTGQQKSFIEDQISNHLMEFDKTIERAANILSELTNLTAFALTPKTENNKLKYINVLPVDENTVVLMVVAENGKITNTPIKLKCVYDAQRLEILSKVLTYNYKGKQFSNIVHMDIIKSLETDIEAMSRLVEDIMPDFMKVLENMLNVELYMDGFTNIFSIPEYNDLDRARMFLEMMKKKERITDVLNNRDDGTMITIGQENIEADMKEYSLITATYRVDGQFVGKLGVIGPTRMKYDKITSIIEHLTDNLSSSFRVKDK